MSDDAPTDYAAWGALVLLSLLVLAYSVLITTQVLLGVLVVCLLWAVPLWWRLIRGFIRFVDAAEAVADALQRLAAVREREAGESGGGGAEAGRMDADGMEASESAANDR